MRLTDDLVRMADALAQGSDAPRKAVLELALLHALRDPAFLVMVQRYIMEVRGVRRKIRLARQRVWNHRRLL
jgi:hypothetical protein